MTGHCCDQCPLCRFAAQAVALVPPDLPALPDRLEGDAHAIRAPPGGRRSSRLSRPAKSRPGAAPRRLTIVWPTRALRRAFAFLQTRGLPLMTLSKSARPRARSARRAAASVAAPAYPHAVCGARIFPATLAIDDPGVLDELTLPAVSYVPFNSDAAHEWDASFAWTKTITPGLSVVISDGPTWEHPGGYGWNGLDTELQWQALCLPDAEFMFKVGFDISWAGTGTGIQAGSGGQNTYSPLVVAGLGFGTLPSTLKYLRPFAITAEFSTSTPGQDWTNGNPNVSTFNWGFTLQYSLPYFNTQLAEIDNDFLKHLVPIAEFAFRRRFTMEAPPGTLTTGYFQPGVIYEADKWQIALEAMVPMTGATGHGVGVIGSLDFYLDDIPNRIDEPIFPHGLGIAPGI